ncbi:potassium transporter 5-like [Tasmannia lanceolata]|uniref:potassium transporter 5-like n=1 Tax=Tasmannia lanceolata TaxID=3420 RepID=UPI0040633AE0
MGDPVQTNVEEKDEEIERTDSQRTLKDRKFSYGKLRVDSLHLEAGRVSSAHPLGHGAKVNWGRTLSLAFQSIGVIYGDVGTSPLYVYSSTFLNGIRDKEDILGVLSLIIYTLLLIPFIKYVFIVLWANDNGDGGTFALYSLICRNAKVSLIPNQQPEDTELSNYRLETPTNQFKRAQKIKQTLENSKGAKIMLFLLAILGTSMVIGDGVLTPCISVLSAVGGIKESATSLTQGKIVIISVVILILLFSVQRFGTDKVGHSFAPIILLWFSFISMIGLYNIFKHDVRVLRAFNPKYIIDYFKRNGKDGWISLGGIVLCITGTEAMFADLGHFSVMAVQISFTTIVLPSLLCAYTGQAAYLTKFPEHVGDTFYKSTPHKVYWPMFIVAVLAAIIASQAMISGTFAIISQSLSLGCFPRVKVVHTSSKYEGQVYIPEINYGIMIACVIVTIGFQTTDKIGNAYGIAVVAVMVITTSLLTLIMLMIWKTNILIIGLFFLVFGGSELIYLSSVLEKFIQGGYFPLAVSLVLIIIMGVWHYVYRKRYMFELQNKVSNSHMRDLVMKQDLKKLPGMGFLYSELVQGIPPIFPHFISNIPFIHSVLVFVSIKAIPISKVAVEERFLFRQVEPRECRMFRCVVRYGYNDVIEEHDEFERLLVEHLKGFIRQEQFFIDNVPTEQTTPSSLEPKDMKPHVSSGTIHPRVETRSANSSSRIISGPIQGAEEEIQFIQAAFDKGVVYLLSETEVVAEQNSSIVKKIVINYVYNFIRRNFRQGENILSVPHQKLVRVGMTYEI